MGTSWRADSRASPAGSETQEPLPEERLVELGMAGIVFLVTRDLEKVLEFYSALVACQQVEPADEQAVASQPHTVGADSPV